MEQLCSCGSGSESDSAGVGPDFPEGPPLSEEMNVNYLKVI